MRAIVLAAKKGGLFKKFTSLLYGAVIEEGPKQILQQSNGKADVVLSRSWHLDALIGHEKVYVRIVEKCSGSIIIPWS